MTIGPRPARRQTRPAGWQTALARFALAAAATTLPSLAHAEPPDRASAKEAYDRGLEAHERGDEQTAAEEFARADALSPSPVALQAALDAAIGADDAALGAELLERSKRAPPTPTLASSITAAHLKFRGRAGRVRVTCPTGARCVARMDERPIDVDKDVWATTGKHSIVVDVDGKAQRKIVDVTADGPVDVTPVGAPGRAPSGEPAATPVETPPPRREGEGLPRIFFYGGVGLTVGLAGVTTYFALDTKSEHDRFEDLGCARTSFPECASIKRSGVSGQHVTNVMLVLTGASAVATAVVGAVFTNWKGPLLALAPGGGGATWRATF